MQADEDVGLMNASASGIRRGDDVNFVAQSGLSLLDGDGEFPGIVSLGWGQFYWAIEGQDGLASERFASERP